MNTHQRALAHGHGLDTIDGYRVVVTRREGRTLNTPHVVADHIGATQYGEAMDIARLWRRGGSWAVVDTLYACGCWSTDRYTDMDMARENN